MSLPAASASLSDPAVCPTLLRAPGGDAGPQFDAAMAAYREALATATRHPTDPAAVQAWRNARLRLASQTLRLGSPAPESPVVQALIEAIRATCVSGLMDLPATPGETGALGDCSRGTAGLLAGMLLSPLFRWSAAPALDRVPNALWGLYALWAFTPPQSFAAPGEAQAYADALLPRLETLASWVERNWGSAAVRSAAETYLRTACAIPLYFSAGSLRRHAEARGRILQRAFSTDGRDLIAPEAFARYGRPLRIGFLNRHFGSQTETYTTLPTFEHLDPERFELVLFTCLETGSPLETYCRSRAREFHVLPTSDVAAQVETIRLAGLDVLVFGTNVTAVVNEITRLATHRMAPLQVVNNSSCITSGLTEIDLYVSGDLTEIAEAAEHFSERLALLPGPAHAFNYEADAEPAATTPDRADYGIPADALLFVSAANYYKLVPEVQHTWARLLAAHPESRLLVHPFNPNWSASYPIERFRAEFNAVLAAHGVEPSRLTLSTTFFPGRADVKALLALGDIYLDTYPFAGVNSLVDPLELGLPVVVRDGDTFRSRMAGALMRSLDLADFIATDEESYLRLAWDLATDPAHRATASARIRAAMESAPLFLDPLAASDAFGDLMEHAYDELAVVGTKTFRGNRTALRAASESEIESLLLAASTAAASGDTEAALAASRAALRAAPGDGAARRTHARALLASGQAARAATYFLSSLQGAEDDASLWFDCARALSASGDNAQAVPALEACLRLDPHHLEGWFMMADLASAVGSAEIAAEALDVARQLAPQDPRLLAAV